MRGSLGLVRAVTAVAVAAGVASASLFTASVPASVLATGPGIVGLVTDESGTPLGGIQVEACPGPACATTTTSSTVADGANFHLGPLVPGAYRVSFHDPTLNYAFGYFGSGGYAPDNAVLLPVGSATDVRADVRLPLANRLTGTITGRGGIPLAGIDVLAIGPGSVSCVLPLGCLRNTTGVDGTFTVRGLRRGTYEVRFGYQLGTAQGVRWYTTSGDSRDPTAATPIAIDGSDRRIDAALELDADSCNRPLEPFRGWTLVPYPYACRNGSPRRALIGGQELQTVIGGGPGFVALGRREFVPGAAPEPAAFTSVSGATWTAYPVDRRVSGHMASGHGLIVAVGPGAGGRSADGITWKVATAPPSPTATVVAVTGDGPGFVAIGQRSAKSSHAAVWTSIDGLRWRQVPDQPAFGHFCARSIAGGARGLVAVGGDCHSPTVTSAVVLTSRDGRSWTRAATQSAFSGNTVLTAVIPGGPGFIATGGYRPTGGTWGTSVWTSRTGLTWRRVAYFRTGWMLAGVDPYWILRAAGGFVAAEPTGKTLISRDGATWTAKPSAMHPDDANGGTWDMRDAAGSGSTVVMVGSYAPSDGSTLVEYGGLVWTGASL